MEVVKSTVRLIILPKVKIEHKNLLIFINNSNYILIKIIPLILVLLEIWHIDPEMAV